jgi:hypothetical protein
MNDDGSFTTSEPESVIYNASFTGLSFSESVIGL